MYWITEMLKEEVGKQIDDLLTLGLTETSANHYGYPI